MGDDNRNRKRNKRRRKRTRSSSNAGPGMVAEPQAPRSNIPYPVRSDGSVDPFALFCAMHLGIGTDDNYQPMGVPGVARRFGTDARSIRDAMRDYALDNDSLRKLDYRLDWARMDARSVPEGISRTEIARIHWTEFLEAAKEVRDWQSILSVPAFVEEEEEEEDDDEGNAENSLDSEEPKPQAHTDSQTQTTSRASEAIASEPSPNQDAPEEKDVAAKASGDEDAPKPKPRRRSPRKKAPPKPAKESPEQD